MPVKTSIAMANILATVKAICIRVAHLTLAQFTNVITPRMVKSKRNYVLMFSKYVPRGEGEGRGGGGREGKFRGGEFWHFTHLDKIITIRRRTCL